MKKLIILLIATLLSFNGFAQSVSPGFGQGKVAETQSRVLTDGGDIYPNCAPAQIDELKRADIYDKAVLAIRAGVGAKAGTLYNTSDSATGDLTSTRSSVRSTTDTDGNVSSIAINYPAIDYSLGCPFISLESGSTNLFLNSDVGVTQTVTVVSGQDYAFYFRSGTGSIALTDAATQTINISDGTFDNAYLFTAASTSLVCTVTGTANEVQCELNDHASSYIVTDGSTATRAADALTDAGDATLFSGVNSSGVLFAEIAAHSDDGTTRALGLSDETINNRVNIYFSSTSNTIGGFVVVGGVTVADLSYVVTDFTAFSKVAIRWSSTGAELYIDGVEVGTPSVLDCSFPATTFTTANFHTGGGTGIFYGKDKQFGIFYEMDSTDCVNITTP